MQLFYGLAFEVSFSETLDLLSSFLLAEKIWLPRQILTVDGSWLRCQYDVKFKNVEHMNDTIIDIGMIPYKGYYVICSLYFPPHFVITN